MATNTNEIFERVEKKYCLSASQYKNVMSRMQKHMKMDQYGLSTICNIYYDTEDYELIRRSIEKPVYKEKLRLRSYGIPGENDRTFLEIKKKYDGIVYKRRISMTLKDAGNYLEHGIKPQNVNEQILSEIDYFISYYHPVPKVFLAYDRIAMYGIEDASIRVTFDHNIRSRQEDLKLSRGDIGHLLMEDGEVLMEIKVSNAYPLWLTSILSEFEVYPTSFSKYGEIYKKVCMEEREIAEGGEHICLPA